MAVELKQIFGVDAQLVKKSGGIFEVFLNDKLIFSKSGTGRFPEPGEVIANINAKTTGQAS